MDIDLSLLPFWLKKLVALCLLPPVLPLLPLIAGLLLRLRMPRAGAVLAWSGVILSLALIFPPVVGVLLRGLEVHPPFDPARTGGARAIVILGAGKREYAPEFGGETVNRLALERLRYGARLARHTGLPVLLSGGAPSGQAAEAVLMQHSLMTDFGIRPHWLETASRDTHENALFSALQLKAAGIGHIVLVTHAVHMRRAQAEFEAQGLKVSAAPTGWLGGAQHDESLRALAPGPNTAWAGWAALHEYLGLLALQCLR
jgi:uncharacterized SAM-binding protein YcdF (DUF218 family)